jgi:2-dehydro-3-deoxyphosphogluconate aldolase/(4S)-4-hydroxy-2-oxoglutarate aldolase
LDHKPIYAIGIIYSITLMMTSRVMSRFLRHRVIESILTVGLIPVFYHDDLNIAKKIVKACHDGGAKVVEFTNRGARAHEAFKELAEWCERELLDCILGAGTIVDQGTATLYINNGADYIIGPTLNHEVARICNRRRVLYIPGCHTPTEISEAEGLGIDIIKLFPASVLTPNFVKALYGPMPRSLIMPSGGIRNCREEVTEWIRSGAVALNMGSDLIRSDLVESGDFDKIAVSVRKCLGWITEAREGRTP